MASDTADRYMLSPEERQILKDRADSSRREIAAVYNTASNAAITLNMPAKLKRSLASVTASEDSYFGGPDGKAKSIANIESKINQVAPIASRMLQDKQFSQMVTFDPESGEYVPAIPRPRWLQVQNRNQAPGPAIMSRVTGNQDISDAIQEGISQRRQRTINLAPGEVSVRRTNAPPATATGRGAAQVRTGILRSRE